LKKIDVDDYDYMFEQLIDILEENLKNPLPGEAVQMKMSPSVRNLERYGIDPLHPPKKGSVLILLYPHENKIFIPLMQRPDYNGAHSGQISFPGGKFEEGDKSLIDTAIREAYEEVGIMPDRINVIGTLSELYIMASNFNVLPVVAYTNSRPEFIPNQYEVQKLIEADLHCLMNEANIKRTVIKVRNNISIDSPYYDVQDHIVWGATAMMLSEFLHLVQKVS
jgi:8-oxo-dGTP pyrophosphatase MutT (NUDIX family)